MGIADFFSDLMSSMSFQEVHAEAPKEDEETAAGGDEGEEPKDDEAKEEGEDEPAEEAQEGEAEEEDEDDEPVDPKPKLEEGMCSFPLILHLFCGC